MNDKISVIVPVYNVEKYINQCLESILNQTYKNFEIIVVNDGSNDSSGVICDKFAKIDSRIKVIHQKNQGLSGARNTGLKNITGEYVTFIDSDDFIKNIMFEEMLLILKEKEVDIVECGTIYCDEKGSYIKENTKNKIEIYEKNNQMKELISNGNITTMSWGKLYKKDLFKNFEFPVNKFHEDVFTTYKLLHISKKTIVLNQGFYYYRQVSGSIMNSSFNIKHLDSIKAILERNKFIEKYYPQYKKYDYANVVYSSCKVYERMILSNFYEERILKDIQKLIRKYLICFLIYSKSQKSTKLFASICFINMFLCRKFYNIFFKVKKWK